MSDTSLTPNESKVVLYTTSDGDVNVGVMVQDETVWLTQQQIADLFDRNRSVITKHLQNILCHRPKQITLGDYGKNGR